MPDSANKAAILERKAVCEKHGEFLSQGISRVGIEIWSPCPQCREERNAEVLRGVTVEKGAAHEKQRFAFIPERYRQETFDTYTCTTERQRRVVQYLREYRGDKNIILYGNPGTGKTHLLWALIKVNREAQYWRFCDIIRRVRCSFAPTAHESEDEILHELSEVKILVIDEVRQTKSQFETNLIFDLIDMRYSNYRVTILCSNLPLFGKEGEASITGSIGETTMDRINEHAIQIYCDWANYRKKQP
jgi:DNA replication protein DnaC